MKAIFQLFIIGLIAGSANATDRWDPVAYDPYSNPGFFGCLVRKTKSFLGLEKPQPLHYSQPRVAPVPEVPWIDLAVKPRLAESRRSYEEIRQKDGISTSPGRAVGDTSELQRVIYGLERQHWESKENTGVGASWGTDYHELLTSAVAIQREGVVTFDHDVTVIHKGPPGIQRFDAIHNEHNATNGAHSGFGVYTFPKGYGSYHGQTAYEFTLPQGTRAISLRDPNVQVLMKYIQDTEGEEARAFARAHPSSGYDHAIRNYTIERVWGMAGRPDVIFGDTMVGEIVIKNDRLMETFTHTP